MDQLSIGNLAITLIKINLVYFERDFHSCHNQLIPIKFLIFFH